MHLQYKLSIIHMAQCFVDNIIYGQLYYAVFGRLLHSPLSMFTACLWGNFLIVWSESLQLGYRDCQSRGIFYSVKGLAGQYLMEALKYGRYSSSFCDNLELLAFIILLLMVKRRLLKFLVYP